MQLYNTILVRPVITNEAETWPLQNIGKRKLIVWEKKISRKIFYRPVKDIISDKWRIRTNNELELVFLKPNISETIKSRRLQWAGHDW